jgi:1-pyrroline-5-carboxylate dehydrogenase
MGALFMGNKVLVKVDSKVSLCLEEFIRLLLSCGMPKEDVILIHTNGINMEELIKEIDPRMTLFTGSKKIAEKLSKLLSGRIKIEDAGFDWKILGPDINLNDIDYTAHISDQDAYSLSGQKCSAQSLLFVHKNWIEAKFINKIKELAEQRSYKNGTLSPIMTLTNQAILNHIDNVLKIPGSQILFGGKPVTEQHSIPDCYGSFKPTAIYVPLKAFKNQKYFDIITTEIFGPFQIVTEYTDKEIDSVLEVMDSLDQQLTAAVVSNNISFLNKVLSHSCNGVTYAGIKARTTGAPQNHWFGPCGDPRAGGIGTSEAIKLCWSSHREIIMDTDNPIKKKLEQV